MAAPPPPLDLPANAHVSRHPCVQAKLSQLRSATPPPRDVQTLVHEIALMVGYEALGAALQVQEGGEDRSPLGYTYTTSTTSPAPPSISLVPILRSGLSMLPALQALLPAPTPVHHLGLYREKTTLQPVEYYNNLPYHAPTPSNPHNDRGPADLAIVLDPVIATGATAAAAIDSLRDWGVGRVVLVAVLATRDGLRRACAEWDGVQVWVGGCDGEVDERGMIVPGLGDIGDRLFLTLGK